MAKPIVFALFKIGSSPEKNAARRGKRSSVDAQSARLALARERCRLQELAKPTSKREACETVPCQRRGHGETMARPSCPLAYRQSRPITECFVIYYARHHRE